MNSEGLVGEDPFERQANHQPNCSRGARARYLRHWWRFLACFILCNVTLTVALSALAWGTSEKPAVVLGPPLPYILYGYTYDSASNLIGSVNVTIANMNTADTGETVSDGNGYYQFDLANLPNGYSLGDTISIVGNTTEYVGYNSTAVTGSGGKWLNVTLDSFIPEFPSVLVPIGGMMIIVSLAPTIRRRVYKKQDCSS